MRPKADAFFPFSSLFFISYTSEFIGDDTTLTFIRFLSRIRRSFSVVSLRISKSDKRDNCFNLIFISSKYFQNDALSVGARYELLVLVHYRLKGLQAKSQH